MLLRSTRQRSALNTSRHAAFARRDTRGAASRPSLFYALALAYASGHSTTNAHALAHATCAANVATTVAPLRAHAAQHKIDKQWSMHL